MSTPLSICDISARYGQALAPQQTVEAQAGLDFNRLMQDYMRKVRLRRKEEEEDAVEDALMAVIDAMNASEEDIASGKTERTLTKSLAQAGKAVTAQHEEVMEDGTKKVEWVDPATTLTVQVLMSCLGDRFLYEQSARIQEDQENLEQETGEERLKVTEARDPSDTIDPDNL